MTKDIKVQAKADYIASLAHASPVAAVEELVWNALDADAREVKVDIVQNALGAVEALRVHGFWKGSLLTVWRLMRCQPFCEGGYDPVPPRREKK